MLQSDQRRGFVRRGFVHLHSRSLGCKRNHVQGRQCFYDHLGRQCDRWLRVVKRPQRRRHAWCRLRLATRPTP
jgi:hypothetical protein